MDDLLQQGITAYKAGKRDEARRIFIAVVKQSPDNEENWKWMINVCNTDKERIHCLKQMLRINPKNELAQQSLNKLLAPPFTSDGPSGPVPPVTRTPSPSKMKAVSKNSDSTKTQLFILFGLGVTVLFIFGFAILFILSEKNHTVTAASPTSSAASSANNTSLPTQVQTTPTQIPTYAYAPTWTPLPSPTSFVIATLVPPTPIPQQAQQNPANPPSVNSGSNCQSQLDYAAAMHQYNLDAIDYIHAPLISLYQSWIDEAAGNRDALGMVEAERKLDNEKAQVKAEKAAENKRYQAEQANINSSCQ